MGTLSVTFEGEKPAARRGGLRVGISAGMIQGGRSGVAQYVFALTRALLARPDCPGLVVFAAAADEALFEFVGARAEICRVPDRFRRPLRNILWHQGRLPGLVARLGLDVLHVPSYRRLLWRKPCRLLATIHDLAPFHLRAKYDPARMFYGRVIARQLARRQDQIIAVSHSTGHDIERFFGISRARIEVIWNGLDHDRFRPGDPEAARGVAARMLGLDRPYFLYTSRLEHPAKNHVRLIQAFARFRSTTRADWLLALAGSDWHGADAIRSAAAQSGAGEGIRFLGFVPERELPGLYQGAGAVVFPSLFEGFGLPPLEAMACGAPVLSSRRGALKEVVADAAGLLEPEDVGQMAAALERLVRDAAWREDLRAAGLRNARRFSWEETAARVLRCYRRLAGA